MAKRLASARNYWVVTSRMGGGAHASPVWGLWLDGRFWFSTDPTSVKGRDIATNPRIAIHLESGDEAVIVGGTAERLAPDHPALSRFVELYEEKYGFHPDVSRPSFGIYRVEPRAVYAWFEKNFAESATRWFL